MSLQTFSTARKELANRLSAFLTDAEAGAESWQWFEDGLGWDRARVFAHGDEPVPADVANRLEIWFDRRKLGEPWAYILGWTIWRGRRFCVTSATLIPRPETEQVLEAAMRLANSIGVKRVVDVGTGSGILAVTLALETSLDVAATDISSGALGVAGQNAAEYGVNVSWHCGDLLNSVPDPIELVVSNPPYIDINDSANLQREISFEPRAALFAPDGGMGLIKRLLEQCLERRARGAVIEIGSGQGAELKSAALKMGWQSVEIQRDIAGHDRVLVTTL